MEPLELQNLYFYKVWSFWSSKSSFFLTPKKPKKPFKTNALGVFLGTHLAPLWARTCFFDRPMVAHHGPSAGIRNSHFSNIFQTFCALGFLLCTVPACPSFQKTLKKHWFYNIFDTFTGPMLSHQWRVNKNASWPTIAPRETSGKRPNR